MPGSERGKKRLREILEAHIDFETIPNLFEAVGINDHLHRDGLFSQNPPVGDLMGQPLARKPDELWIVQVNSQEGEGKPTMLEELVDLGRERARAFLDERQTGRPSRVGCRVRRGRGG